MTRKLLSAILALILCFSLAATVSADANEIDFIIDDFDYLSSSEQNQLNDLAYSLYEQTGVGMFFVYAQTDDVETYDVSPITNGMTDYVVMLENETHWYMHLGGAGERIELADEEALRDAYDGPDTYAEGVEDFLYAAAEYFPALPAATVPIVWDENERFVYDEADLLTESEETALEQKLMDISHSYNTQLVVYTASTTTGGDIDSFADFLYDSMGFGYGELKEGVMLLICMDLREYQILSNGQAGIAIGTDEIDVLCDFMNTYLPEGHYTSAFHAFADQCAVYLDGYQNGYAFNFKQNLAISLVIGILVGLIVVFILKAQLKSVHQQSYANEYVRSGSMQININEDIFLYRHVTRTKKPKETSSSSSHSGGSARSRGGGSF